ncbi:hypothetical protein [Catenuloplanes japonicus]|uniref:hypothetical protein n=1 Tax=Catenuloplanes japonicus TaxID=33876 RepID=UPI000527619F|nr:hypothetical protein [Catenuloplanes japonicus]
MARGAGTDRIPASGIDDEGRADFLHHLGDAHEADGDRDAARAGWSEAWGILLQLGHPDADGVRAKLDAATRTSAG